MKRYETDALVVGAGPAGLALAYELIGRGVQTLCVAPKLGEWAPTYGAWADELSDLDVPAAHAWDRARVSFPRHPGRVLDRAYVKIDSSALFDRWSSVLTSLDAFIGGVVAASFFSGDSHEIRLESGATIRARQVFDASGHDPRIVTRDPSSHAHQTAFGVYVASSDNTMSQDTMGLMIWDDGVKPSEQDVMMPAFYYEMPESTEKTFVEYTVLARRPFVSLQALERQLRQSHGSNVLGGEKVERCVIPMGYAVPHLDQRVVGFGGAASMVHPATGYMMARTLRTAPILADAYLAVRGQPAAVRSRALWDVIWPAEAVRAHELYRFGLEALLTMDVPQTHAFFSAFFGLPDELWQPYQSGTATPAQIAAAMWAVFRAVGPGLKLKLTRAGLGHVLG